MLLPRRVIFIFGLLIIEARVTAPHSEFDTLPTATVSDVEQAESSIAATAIIKITIFFIAYIFLSLKFCLFANVEKIKEE
jgi:hypothetical protein